MGRIEDAMTKAVRDSHVEPDPGAISFLTEIAVRMYAIFTEGGVLTDDSKLDNTALNALGYTASRYGALGARELSKMVAAGVPFREDVVAELPESHRQAVREALSRPPTKPDFWPGPLGYAVALHDALREAENEQDGSDARKFYLMGLRVAAGLYGLPGGDNPAAVRPMMGGLDLMPVFVIKGHDKLGPTAVELYAQLCRDAGLDGQSAEVVEAAAEMWAWQDRHPDRVRLPDHPHVPVRVTT